MTEEKKELVNTNVDDVFCVVYVGGKMWEILWKTMRVQE